MSTVTKDARAEVTRVFKGEPYGAMSEPSAGHGFYQRTALEDGFVVSIPGAGVTVFVPDTLFAEAVSARLPQQPTFRSESPPKKAVK